MSNNKETEKIYAKKLSQYAEKLNFSTIFDCVETLSQEEHKMLVEGNKSNSYFSTQEFREFERADLIDFFNLERSDGGTIH